MKLLPKPSRPNANIADQCRELGVEVGDALYRRKEGHNGKWYAEVMVVVFIGMELVVFEMHHMTDRYREWVRIDETTEWRPHQEHWYLLERGKAWPVE
jgi:hypothetical protein